jgi:hypothetical protein
MFANPKFIATAKEDAPNQASFYGFFKYSA